MARVGAWCSHGSMGMADKDCLDGVKKVQGILREANAREPQGVLQVIVVKNKPVSDAHGKHRCQIHDVVQGWHSTVPE